MVDGNIITELGDTIIKQKMGYDMVVYKTINLINGKIYIGQDSKNNPKYLGSGVLIKKAIIKYGKENFRKEILEFCNTHKELSNQETYWINKLNAIKYGNW